MAPAKPFWACISSRRAPGPVPGARLLPVPQAVALVPAVHGRARRHYLEVTKFRGSDLTGGLHSLKLTDTGMQVFPRLAPATYGRVFQHETIPSGVPAMDELLHGGIRLPAGGARRGLGQFAITRHGIRVGRPLTDLQGILRGSPEWVKDTGGEAP